MTRLQLQAWHAGVYRAPGLLVAVGEVVEVDDAAAAVLLRDFPGNFVAVAAKPEPADKPKADAKSKAKPEPADKPKG